ncbi:hypothetical protein [Nannocystis pusilla]|uniref:hypothetical protein n=1 Tax=Nannocystis pusilla TaxID=889268 RepID=UPI003BF45484
MRQIQGMFFPTAMGLALLLGGASEADASNGTIKGTLRFHNKNGSYCPTGATCTGSTYKQTSYNVLVGIPEVEVQVIRASDGVAIGTGSTDSGGNYQIAWTSGAGTSDVPAKLRVRWKHKNGRFQFHKLGNTPHSLLQLDRAVTLTHGTTAGAPQQGSLTYGNSATPEPMANLYWAAWKMNAKLQSSSRMVSFFTSLDILAFEASPSGTVKTNANCAKNSCAIPARYSDPPERPAWAEKSLTLVLDGHGATPYTPMKLMHEMGHMADFISGPVGNSVRGLRRETSYCYGESGSCPWTMTSTEYLPSALTEGLASFLAMTAFYDGSGSVAYHCNANGNVSHLSHCYPPDTSFAVMSMEAKATCASPMARRPYNAMRFFWDIYDTPADGTDATDLDIGEIFDSLAAWPCTGYPACYGAGQLHDQFSSVSASLYLTAPNASQLDEGNATRFRDNMLNNYSGHDNVTGAYNQNCMGNP